MVPDPQHYYIRWACDTSKALHAHLETIVPLFQEARPKIEQAQGTLHQLALSCHLTSESAALLVANARIWDTEVLIRSISEGTVRFVYISDGTEADRNLKVKEYGEDVPEITRIKRHDRVNAFFKLLNGQNTQEWDPLREMLLSDVELTALRGKYPKAIRQQINHRWSFNELLSRLARSGTPSRGFELLPSLTYGYGMSSHLIHQDSDAVNMIWERNQRDEVRRVGVEMAHAARELSDVLTMALLRSLSTHYFFGESTVKVWEVHASFKRLFDEWSEVHARWWATESKHVNAT